MNLKILNIADGELLILWKMFIQSVSNTAKELISTSDGGHWNVKSRALTAKSRAEQNEVLVYLQ